MTGNNCGYPDNITQLSRTADRDFPSFLLYFCTEIFHSLCGDSNKSRNAASEAQSEGCQELYPRALGQVISQQ